MKLPKLILFAATEADLILFLSYLYRDLGSESYKLIRRGSINNPP